MSNKKSPTYQDLQAEINRLSRRIDALAGKLKFSNNIPEKEWYRPGEVCQLLGISRTKFETFKRAGTFSVQKIGGSVYVPSSDLKKLLKHGHTHIALA